MYLLKESLTSLRLANLKINQNKLFFNIFPYTRKYSTVCSNLRSKLYLYSEFFPIKRYIFTSFQRFLAKDKMLPFEVNTNVVKDVLLFQYNNHKFLKLITYFGALQFIFWIYLAQFSYTHLIDISKSEEEKLLGIKLQKTNEEKESSTVSWWRRINLGEKKYRNGITILCFSVGYVLLFGTWIFSLRTVYQLILLKGGKAVEIITYAPFGATRSIIKSLDDFNCKLSRQQAPSHIPIKVKGRWFFFLLDKRGHFYEPKLYDNTVGIKRMWS